MRVDRQSSCTRRVGLVAAAFLFLTLLWPAGAWGATSGLVLPAAVPAPVVKSITPHFGPAAGGTAVTITGAVLTGATAVRLGAHAAATFSVISATEIDAVSPPGVGGAFVTVETPDGTSPASSQASFTYLVAPAVSAVSPASGPTAGGIQVTIVGSRFTGAT
jgi:IPT/TIG domain-containing protein